MAQPHRSVRALRFWAGGAIAVVAGSVWAVCFARVPLLVVPWLAFVPLLILMRERHPGWLGFLFGCASWAVAIPWIVPTLETYGSISPWLAWPLFALLVSYLGLYATVFAWLGARMLRLEASYAFVALPALWVALEWVRGHLMTGFPWNLAAYAAIRSPGALRLSAWVGPYGVSFLVIAASTGIALAVIKRRWHWAAMGVMVPLVFLAMGGRFAGAVEAGNQMAALPVRVIQPNIPVRTSWSPELFQSDYQRLLRLSRDACDRQGALLIWPESAAWPYSWRQDPLFRRDVMTLTARGCELLLNSDREHGGKIYNAALLVDRSGLSAEYDKRHLVPFGEYVPLRRILPFVGTLARNAGDFSAAERIKLIPWRGEKLGVAICYEIVFPAEVAELVRHGATALVTMTNDAWYGDTFAPWQHFRAARFRAAENARPVLRAAITGVSGWIAPDGSVVSELGVGKVGILSGDLSGRLGETPYTRFPWLIPALSILIALSAIFSARRR